MATAKELLDAGKLQAAIEELANRVKATPSDTHERISLFELLLFAGDWERAERQVDVIAHQSMESGLGVQVYRNNIKAERERSRLFSDGLRPHFISVPPAYVELHLRDLVWTPARIEATDGTSGEIYIHTLYEGSGNHADDQVKLGRMTDWKDAGEGLYLASGSRLFLIDGEDRALLEVRKIEFAPAAYAEPVAALDERDH